MAKGLGNDNFDELADVRDGLNHKQRVVLWCLQQLQTERNGGYVPTAMLYGRVVELIDISVEELQAIVSAAASDP